MSTEMSTVCAFSRLIQAPPGCHAVAMTNEATVGDRGPLIVTTLMFLLTFLMLGVFVVVTFAQWLNLSATTTALVLESDGPYTGAYQYAYAVADRACLGTASPEPPLPKPGAKIQIHYDPNNICDSVTDNPTSNFIAAVFALVFISPWLAVMVLACWPRKGPA